MYWLWLAFWVQCVWLATRIGKRKGQAAGAFFIAMILGPVGVLVALASSGRRDGSLASSFQFWNKGGREGAGASKQRRTPLGF